MSASDAILINTEDALNPHALWSTAYGNLPLAPPFNRISRYRDPGLINLNTIMDDGDLFQALFGEYPDPGSTNAVAKKIWQAVAGSRLRMSPGRRREVEVGRPAPQQPPEPSRGRMARDRRLRGQDGR